MRKIVKLILKCGCVMLPMLVVLIYFHLRPLSYADGEIPYYIWNREKTNHTCDKTYETIILGDSVANAAYAPELLSDKTINLSLGGTSAVENYYILKDWLEHNKAPKACYISFMDFHMASADCFWTRSMYSHRFRFDQNAEMLSAAVKYDEPGFLSDHYILDYISYELRLPNKYIAAFSNASFNQRYKGNIEAWRLDELHGGRYIGRGTAEYQSDGENVYTEFTVHPMFDAYYRKILEVCRENHIAVHIVKLPLPENRVFTREYKEMFEIYYNGLMEDFPEITVDWMENSYPKSYFTDVHHMNSRGALQFSSDLKKRYPEDFDDSELSEEQIAAINDSIAGENKVEQILKWIAGRNYTVVLYDGDADFEYAYRRMQEEEPDLDELILQHAGMKSNNFYYISGKGEENPCFSISEENDITRIALTENTDEQWEIAPVNDLSVMVLDNYNNRIVCKKNYKRVQELYQLTA